MKRIVSLVLALAMVLSLCIFTTASADDGFVDGKFTETRHITVEVYNRYNDGGSDPTSSVYAQYIKQGMLDKYNVDVELVSVGRWTEVDDLNNLLATGDAPDVCVTYSYPTIQTFAGMDGIIDLNPLLTEYKDLLPDLWALLGDYNIYYDQDPETGSVWAIEAVLAESARINTFIRKDWLEKLNMEVPTNVEELYAYLKAAKEQKLGGDNTIPYSSDLYAADPFYGWIYQMDAFLDYSQITEEDWVANFKFHYMLPGAKEALRWMNKFFNEGLVSDYFGIENSKQTDSDRVNGYDGFWVGNWDAPWRMEKSYAQDLAKNVPGASWIACDPFKPEDGTTPHETYTAAGQAIFIPASVDEKVAVAAIKYLNWMCKPESLYALQNGEKGYNYTTVNENNIPTDLKNINDTDDAHKMHATDGAPICNGFYYGSDELNYAATAMGFPGYEDVVADSLVISNDGAYEPVSFTRTIQSRIDYGTTIVSKEAELLVQVVTCKPEDFDATWDKYINEILSAGGQQIIDEQREAYQEGAYRGFYPMAQK